MSAPKHTPGPWVVATELPGELTVKVAGGDWYVAGCLPGGKPTEEANARLIASAPDLLEALVEAEAGLEFAGADVEIAKGAFVPSPTLALRAVRAAIAKATGARA